MDTNTTVEYFDLDIPDSLINATLTKAVLLDNYRVLTGKNGEYIAGRCRKMRKFCDFKVFSSPLVQLLKTADLEGSVVLATFTGNEYNGSRSIIINGLGKLPTGEIAVMEPDPAIFDTPLDIEAQFRAFSDYISTHLSPEWCQVINIVFGYATPSPLYEAFKNERAGLVMHDAIRGGLLNHTLKMLNILEVVLANDKRLEKLSDSMAYMLRTGIILHDLGKVEEMKNGVEQHYARVHPHQVKGVCYLERNRTSILRLISEDDLMRLESIILGHHGGMGGAPDCTTIYAYIVHLIDLLDSQVTGILDRLENPANLRGDVDKYIPVNDKNLYV